jgi:glycerol kinase
MTTLVKLGIDQGSSSTKGVLTAPTGDVLSMTSVQVHTRFASDGVAEQDPDELLASIRECRSWADAWCAQHNAKIDGIGFSFQRSGAVAWEGKKTLSPYLSWRDSRLQAQINTLKERLDISEYVQRVGGVPLLAGFAGIKIAYLQGEFPRPAQVGTLDTFVLSQLCSRSSNVSEGLASRSMLYSIQTGDWDPRLCEIMGAQLDRLAKVVPVFYEYGLWDGIPVRVCLGDKQASLVAALSQGYKAVLNLGTISSLCLWSGNVPVVIPGVTTGVVTSSSGSGRTYQLEVGTQVSGDIFDLLKQENILDQKPMIVSSSSSGASLEPVLFAAPRGTGFPDYRGPLAACIAPSEELEEAALRDLYLENVGFAVAQMILELIDRANPGKIDQMIVNGGGSSAPTIMRSLAAGLNLWVDCSDQPEASAWGAALLMTQGCIAIDTGPIIRDSKCVSRYSPEQQRRERFLRWQQLRAQVLASQP